MEQAKKQEQSEQAIQELTLVLNSFLSKSDQERQNSPENERANLLDSSLRTFSSLSFKGREQVLPTLYKFLMDVVEQTGDNGEELPPKATIDTSVLQKLADPKASENLKQLAEELKNITYTNTLGDETRVFKGVYEMTELNEDGSVTAHAVNRQGGGGAHQNMGTLARFSLAKAVLGHHFELAKNEFDVRSTDIRDNMAYFLKAVGLDREHLYAGNDGRLGASGIEMTEERIDALSGGLLDKQNPYWDYFKAGVADAVACKTIHLMRERVGEGQPLENFYIPLPEELDSEADH